MEFAHRPVLLDETVDLLNCSSGGLFVDGTLGGGGHAAWLLKKCPQARLIGIDRDEDALAAAKKSLEAYGERLTLVRDNFRNMAEILRGLGVEGVEGIMLDLGVSSYQFESAGRGFSFRFEARLDMRMDNRQAFSAYDIVNGYTEQELERIFREFGEEDNARRIARNIVRAREGKPVETTGDLVRIVVDAVPRRFHSRSIHPATKVFQALRIAVNEELESLDEGLQGGFESLRPGGRMAVISFHSLEDRRVKTFFRELSTGCVCPPRIPRCVCNQVPRARLVTRKAVTPSEDEVRENPRARSAKLRAIEKI